MILVFGILIAGAVYFMSGQNPSITSNSLPDVEPENQGGNFKVIHDDAFHEAHLATGVPFALIKAHAKRESNFDEKAYRFETVKKGASYGLMQVLWVKGSNRFAKWGYTDDDIRDGSLLYLANINAFLGAKVIEDNLKRLGLRDAINAYNTGVSESVRIAPNNYVNDVLKIYSTLVGREVV